ncbi:sugar/maltose fermentation stimulation protein homolog [Bacillus sp. JCM 19045]|nr:sugar/maltose fermentation stimulation protein homolog [Bacillus sp. JCM 19045]
MYMFDRLTKARFIRRLNRFVLVLKIDQTGEQIEAHLPDPGRLKELLVVDAVVWIQYADNPLRKTNWTAILCETDAGTLVSLKTTLANTLIEEALLTDRLPFFKGWTLEKREYRVDHSRFDFLLANHDGAKLLVEVKSVTLARNEKGFFPDAVTNRGAKHVKELTQLAQLGNYQSCILFVAQREDIQSVSMEATIDPVFAKAVEDAVEQGVHVFAVGTVINTERIEISKQIPVFV